MPDIRILPRHLVNMIAAGEVIERPASVVKELVENALDAGASLVEIAVEDGGRRLISVRDDGRGMDAEDLALAFVPHATSKIASEQDLHGIRTMGFRGEALASIASVSHAHVLSRPRRAGASDGCGHEIRAEGETLEPVRPAASPEGATVSIRDLFFNTPARRKFMRTAETEFGHVVEQLARLALPNCATGFRLTHNGRVVRNLPGGQSLRQRVAELLGADLADGLIDIAGHDGGFRLWGLIGPPGASRATARYQYFFVNGRYVRDRFLGHALREAYRGLMEGSRWPAAFLFVELDPAEVDVNVHPTKIEVRFRNGQYVHSQVFGTVREALNRSNLASPAALGAAPPAGSELPEDARRQSLKQALADFFKSSPPPQRGLAYPAAIGDSAESSRASAVGLPSAGGQYVPWHPSPPAERAWPSAGASAPAAASEGAGGISGGSGGQALATPPAPVAAGTVRAPSGWQATGPVPAMQIHDSFIVAASDDGLIIIDQHALHERIIYQELLDRLGRGNLASQRLLIPCSVEVTAADKAALAERVDLLARLGLEVGEFGPHSVAVQRFPVLLADKGVPPEEFLRDLLDLLDEHAAADGQELLDEVLAALSCKAAVKAGQRLTPQEIESLLARRASVQRHASCPHGRPTTLTLTLEELQRQFKRT